MVRAEMASVSLQGDATARGERRYDDIGSAQLLRSFVIVLLMIGCGLFAASVCQDVYAFRTGTWSDINRIWLLDVDVEKSAFTWVSVSVLTLASAASYQTYQRTRTAQWVRFVWLGLATVFLLLSFDEFASLHELLSSKLTGVMPRGGIFFFAWAIPAGIIALTGLIAMYPFLRTIPLRQRVMLILSALIFVFGAVVLEAIGGMVAEENGVFSSSYRALTNFEEMCEFLGVVLYTWTVLQVPEF